MIKSEQKKIIIGGTFALALFGIIFFLSSDYHAYNVAVKHYRNQKFQAAINILYRLGPKYRHSPRGIYLSSVCQYNLAREAYESDKYGECLNCLALIPETYVNYDAVKELEIKAQQGQDAAVSKRNREMAFKKESAKQKAKEKEQKDIEEKVEAKANETLFEMWMISVVTNVDGLENIALADDNQTLIVMVGDAWYDTPDYLKKRMMSETAKHFASFARGKTYRGYRFSPRYYPTVQVFDTDWKHVGRHSQYGTEILAK